jgi:hypothetical protein
MFDPLLLCRSIADTQGSVHWWPRDHKHTRSWTDWDPEGFNAGVAGPFLKYVKETSTFFPWLCTFEMADRLSFPGQAQPVNQTQGSTTTSRTPDVSAPPALGDTSRPAPALAQPAELTVATQTGLTHATNNRTNYRPLPPRDEPSALALASRKRKHNAKSRDTHPIRYFEGSGSDDEGSDHQSGDGSSSGESLAPDAPMSTKRQKTSRMATRSSTQTLAPDVGTTEVSESVSPTPALLVSVSPSTITGAAAVMNTPSLCADVTATGTPGDLADTPTDIMDPDMVGPLSTYSSDATDPPHTEAEVSAAISARITAVTEPEATAVTGTERATESSPATMLTTPPLPTSSTLINVESVPTFLLRHGKGKREVNIFAYLNEVKDPRFRKLLFHYIQLEASDKSGTGGTLPTAMRPAEISQWTSRARPASLPDYTKGKRTFGMFVDSVFRWWGSIQPYWRTFERGQVSREVNGDWDALYATRINGLLNVVMLAYWWVRILDEEKPEDGVRADYEFFVEDIAWVFANLSTA